MKTKCSISTKHGSNISLAMCSMGNKEKQLQYIIMLYVTLMLFQRIEMS